MIFYNTLLYVLSNTVKSTRFVAAHPLPKAAIPECSISESSVDYRGTQWIDRDGEPCVPWNVSSVRKVSIKHTHAAYIFTTISATIQGRELPGYVIICLYY